MGLSSIPSANHFETQPAPRSLFIDRDCNQLFKRSEAEAHQVSISDDESRLEERAHEEDDTVAVAAATEPTGWAGRACSAWNAVASCHGLVHFANCTHTTLSWMLLSPSRVAMCMEIMHTVESHSRFALGWLQGAEQLCSSPHKFIVQFPVFCSQRSG